MEAKNNLVKKETEKGTMLFQVDGMEVKLSPALVRKYLVNGNGSITDSEVVYFMQLCKARHLNPFTKDCYLIKYSSQPATMVVAKEALERRAVKNEKYNGKKVGIYVENKNGELIKKDNCILLKSETIVGAWCEVYRKDWEYPVKIDVNFEEYIGRTKDGTPNTNWGNRPVTMITKVAKAQALREAFVEELSGMYDSAEVEKIIPEEVINEAETRNVNELVEAEVVTEEKPTKKEKAVEQNTSDDEIASIFGK